ncbi:TadA family conjugal transfer-associated ATPase [Demequina aurantiaca]|uniref:TadA family conjugal transfer-associated ATPase n=1 Tax=Demequina aurantiaca TaxID=676200 RepID=UPI000A013557|nr:TadA family conjugal transfer-associated ATPase [Demequina aurantiaca]
MTGPPEPNRSLHLARLPPPTDPLGPLAAVVRQPGVTDVVVNAPGAVWCDRGLGLERVTMAFADAAAVRDLAVRLASAGGKRLDDASPLVDARLPDGTRLHAALPPIADECALISLRTVRRTPFSIADLVTAGMVQAGLAPLLEGLVRERASVLISGSTGAGKTTLLASLLSLVDTSERIVVIEEGGEVSPTHPHVVRLVERRANVDGAGEIGLARLVREALRMRPDRIVLGECRGAEVRDVLTALNTGHRGGMSTIHANSALDVPARLTALGSLAGMGAESVALHASAAFECVVHVERGVTGRSVVQLGVLSADSGMEVVAAVTVREGGKLERGPAWARLAELAGLTWREITDKVGSAEDGRNADTSMAVGDAVA